MIHNLIRLGPVDYAAMALILILAVFVLRNWPGPRTPRAAVAVAGLFVAFAWGAILL